mmetsp:Transcript_23853/g.59234  ORF Transcript_23853/g.59234 Transcript_23853/m.59234 type:complete len:233 (-) Transcript_23853:127-825(-)
MTGNSNMLRAACRFASSSASSSRWKQRQLNDPYVLKAAQQGYRSRAAFKLLELDQKFRLLKPRMLAVEVGSAPGSWTQILTAKSIRTVAVDCLEMDPLDSCQFIHGDFMNQETQQKLVHTVFDIRPSGADIILSDLSPNRSGIKSLDQARFEDVIENILLLSRRCLKLDGRIVTKLLQSAQVPKIVNAMREFSNPSLHKPAASRKESAEVYLVATNFKPLRFDSSSWQRFGW